MKNYEFIEHTADIRIRVSAPDLNNLFKKSALAMFDIIAEKKPTLAGHRPQVKEIAVKQTAENLEELFINWLNELLSLSAVKEIIFEDFKIKKIDENNIEASVAGVSVDNYKVNTEIKAATYHELKLGQTEAGWLAEVIFDV